MRPLSAWANSVTSGGIDPMDAAAPAAGTNVTIANSAATAVTDHRRRSLEGDALSVWRSSMRLVCQYRPPLDDVTRTKTPPRGGESEFLRGGHTDVTDTRDNGGVTMQPELDLWEPVAPNHRDRVVAHAED